ncbi:MAG: DUF512 domain-containing protein [Abditibacteriota bacterium]|nr:DUF512 domain-containing protein [Abditibacteriota bacterium]
MAAIISKVKPGSIARELSLAKGDEIISVNGARLRDIIDYEYLTDDENVLLLARTKRGLEEFDIEKEAGESLGIEFENAIFDRIKTCGANCVFCFERQLPEGLRPSLKMRDDDYRLSFLYGCYVTLGNLKPEDTGRIISQRLSPLYVSVHAADHALREKLLGKKVPDIISQLSYFIEHGITFHCQAVICPGLNDGPQLEKTIKDLAGLYPGAASLALVPVGLTKHRNGLPQITPVDKAKAAEIIDTARAYGEGFKKTLGTRFVFCADEFYIKAEKPFPETDYYEDYLQYENGIGLVRDFLDNAPKGVKALDRLELSGKRIAIITGKSFEAIMRKTDLGKNKNSFEIVPCENVLFGKTVTVAGLLSGKDIQKNLRGFDAAVIPSVCISDEGVFLDDLTPGELERRTGISIIISKPSLYDMAAKIKKYLKKTKGGV